MSNPKTTTSTSRHLIVDAGQPYQNMTFLRINNIPVVTKGVLHTTRAKGVYQFLDSLCTSVDLEFVPRDSSGRLEFRINDKAVLTSDEVWSKRAETIIADCQTLNMPNLKNWNTDPNILINGKPVISIQNIKNAMKPIGSTYIQFPEPNGNFDNRKSPMMLYGGKWTLRFEKQGLFARTPGKMWVSRQNGIQTSGFGRHRHDVNHGSHSHGYTCSGGLITGSGALGNWTMNTRSGATTSSQSQTEYTTNGNSSTSSETIPYNRQYRIYIKVGL